MLRNDLINRLSDFDNDPVVVRLGAATVDGAPVVDPPEDGFPLPAYEVMRLLALHPLLEVTVAVGAVLVDVCGVSYDDSRDKVVLAVLPEDLADAVRVMNRASG